MFLNPRRYAYITLLLLPVLFSTGYANAQYSAGINTGMATNISGGYALLTGSVNPNGSQATAWFEYGTSNSFGYSTEHKSIGNGTTPVTFAFPLTNISPNTTYYFRIATQSDCYNYQYQNNNYNNNYQNYNYCSGYSGQGSIQYGQTQTFTTTANSSGGTGTASLPGVETTVVTQVTQRSATMHGVARPNNSDTTVWFEYGKTNALGQVSPKKLISAINSSTNVNLYVSGLESGTTYYYRMVGQNTVGKIDGVILSLTTFAGPAPTPAPAPNPNPAPAPAPTSTNNADSNQPPLALNVKIESSEPSAGDELQYTATITNPGDKPVKEVGLAVYLPAEINFIDGGQSLVVENNTVKVTFAEIEKEGKRIVPLRFKVRDSVEKGASLPLGSLLTYTNSQNRQLAVNANAAVLIKNGTGESAGTTAVLSENLPAFLWLKWVLWVLVILLVVLLIYIAYRFMKSWLAMH